MDFLVRKKWFHLIVNPGTAPSPLPDGTLITHQCERSSCDLRTDLRSISLKRSQYERALSMNGAQDGCGVGNN